MGELRWKVAFGVATAYFERHTHVMGREHGGQPSPDLFSAEAARDTFSPPAKPPAASPTTEPAPTRHVLPKNLGDAVKHLNDRELDLLYAATLDEMKRRGKAPSNVGAESAQSSRHDLLSKRPPRKGETSRQRQVDVAEVTLTRGQVNAVRAAFKAGITPSRIARQFGISQSNVRKALATNEPQR